MNDLPSFRKMECITVPNTSLWERCKSHLQQDLPAQQFVTWIQPLTLLEHDQETLILLAPNRFIKAHVQKNFQIKIDALTSQLSNLNIMTTIVDTAAANVSTASTAQSKANAELNTFETTTTNTADQQERKPRVGRLEEYVSPAIGNQDSLLMNEPQFDLDDAVPTNGILDTSVHLTASTSGRRGNNSNFVVTENTFESNVDRTLTFDSFVEGNSNQLAKAAAIQVAENPGESYNPLLLYGASGLGKTHLMQAVGNELLKRNPNARVAYLHSERFVANMVKALQQNKINEFKHFYRSVDALLIDDIQFFAGKDRSQEEFFHTFNTLIEGGQQIILTCDRYPREIKGLEERLKTRFGWGLSVAVEPPELETRVAILMQKANEQNMEMAEDAAFFIARRLRSNVRELEGALKRVIAQAHFKQRPIDIELIKESLKDLISMQDRLVSIDNIQKTVAEYYKIKVSDLHSKRRNRSIARPRQVAMSLAKELTSHSLPEIGEAFGGRDHTTVLHACRKIEELKESNTDIAEDLKNLLRILTT